VACHEKNYQAWLSGSFGVPHRFLEDDERFSAASSTTVTLSNGGNVGLDVRLLLILQLHSWQRFLLEVSFAACGAHGS
jgi:hypothetical protein